MRALVTVLALHQTKGIFFATSLLACTWLSARHQHLLIWRHLLIGTAIAGLPWCWVLVDQGLLVEQIAIYSQFANLRTELGRPAWSDLVAQLHSDAGWWLLMSAAAIRAMLRQHRDHSSHVTLLLSLIPVTFIALHPRPWPYMLAPCVPFLASLGTRGMSSLTRSALANQRRACGMVVACIGLATWGIQNHLHALQADGRSDLHTLELLRIVQTPRDHVLDPSGAAYFIKPIAPDWYLDGLFRHRLDQGTWQPMPSSSDQYPSIVVRSYRLDWITSFPADQINGHYEHACHWIWLRKGDPRIQLMRSKCPPGDADSLLNYWQTLP